MVTLESIEIPTRLELTTEQDKSASSLVERVFPNVALSVTFLSSEGFCNFSLVYSTKNTIQL